MTSPLIATAAPVLAPLFSAAVRAPVCITAPGLRVKGGQGTPGVYEMTWAPDGRATWQYGPERIDGEPHVIWRRVGTHAIFDPGPP